MKKTVKIILGATMTVLLLSCSVWALPYPVVQGDVVTMLSSDDANKQYEGNYQFQTASKVIYGTFCVELNEYFVPGNKYTVSNISAYAENGGVGGAKNKQDYLSDSTKWLFYHFLKKDIYQVTGQVENDYSLQLAFWMLENEFDVTSEYSKAYGKNTVAQDYVKDALASGTAGSAYDVMVMNLVDAKGNFAQSQLVGAAPVPEPGTIALVGFGLLGLAIYGKRRSN